MSSVSEQQRCPKCGGPIPSEAPQGLCPKCLLAEVSIPTEAGQTSKVVPPSRDELASAFPHLEILELIGQGGMGSVFKARQPKLDRFVALKILSQSLAADPAFAERFTREGRVLARLNHPNIVTIHDFGQANGFFYILMEFVDGVNLRQAMHAGRFTPDQALAIVPKICEALQFAHNEGILHRDIKPENILIDIKGRVKIADFGIAKLVGEGAVGVQLSGCPSPDRPKPELQLTQAGAALGTPQYMAPEQIEKPDAVDHRADIYSLGVVFYEMLTGELPLGRFAAPSEKSASDPRLDDVVFRTLEKEPSRRPQSANEVKTRVETIASSTLSETVVSPHGPAGVGKSSHTAALVFALLYVALLGFLAYSSQFLPERAATHFDGDNRPNGWMYRSSEMLFVGAMPLFCVALFWGISRLINRLPETLINVPRRDYWLTPERRPILTAFLWRRLLWFACLLVCFFGGLHYLVVRANQVSPPHLSGGGMLALANGFFIALLIWIISTLLHLANPDQKPPAKFIGKQLAYVGAAFAVIVMVCGLIYFARKQQLVKPVLSDVTAVGASTEFWSPPLAPGEKPDPQSILNEAHQLAGKAQNEEALQRFLWYHNHALEYAPSQVGVRLSFALSYWMELARRYPKAKQALVEIRDRGTHEFTVGAGHFALFMEVSAISKELGEQDATLALFKSIQSRDPKLARQCYTVMEDVLMEKGEYALCASFIPDFQARFENIRAIWERTLEIVDRTPEVKQAALRRQAQQTFIKDTRKLIEILVGVERKMEAEKIREQAVTVLDVPELQSAVIDAEKKVEASTPGLTTRPPWEKPPERKFNPNDGMYSLITVAPVVVETQPVSGSRDVEPGVVEIRVRFSKEMADGSWSWATAWEGSAPELIGAPKYDDDHRTCVVKAKLEPSRTYAFWLNSEKFHGFQAPAGQPAIPYLLIFQTK